MDERGDKNARRPSSGEPVGHDDAAQREQLARERLAEERLAEMRVRLAEAIVGRREVRLVYGSDLTLRLVLPHAIGVGTAGNPLLLAWQVGGGSRTSPTGWKHFALARVRGFDVSDATFRGFAPGYDPDNPSFADVWRAL